MTAPPKVWSTVWAVQSIRLGLSACFSTYSFHTCVIYIPPYIHTYTHTGEGGLIMYVSSLPVAFRAVRTLI